MKASGYRPERLLGCVVAVVATEGGGVPAFLGRVTRAEFDDSGAVRIGVTLASDGGDGFAALWLQSSEVYGEIERALGGDAPVGDVGP